MKAGIIQVKLKTHLQNLSKFYINKNKFVVNVNSHISESVVLLIESFSCSSKAPIYPGYQIIYQKNNAPPHVKNL